MDDKSKDEFENEPSPVFEEPPYEDAPYLFDEDAGEPGMVDDASAQEGMPFLEHLEEFRWTIGRSILAFIVGAGLVACFMGNIAALLQYPLDMAYGSAEEASKNLVTKSPMGVFSVLLQVVFLGGLSFSLPFILYFFGAFVAPGLNENERRIMVPASVAAFLLFIAGLLFSFFVVLPLTLSFSVRLNNYLGFTLWWAASDYFSMVVWFSVALGGFFQFPLITIILVVVGVVTTEQLKGYRRAVLVAIMVFAAFLTPGGDPISLGIMTAPMYGLYEAAILVGKRIEARKRRKEELEEMEEM